jgi:hypothetical protein
MLRRGVRGLRDSSSEGSLEQGLDEKKIEARKYWRES